MPRICLSVSLSARGIQICRGYLCQFGVSISIKDIHNRQRYPPYPLMVSDILKNHLQDIHTQDSSKKGHPVDRIQILRLIAFGFKCRWSSLLFPTNWPVIGSSCCFKLHRTIVGSQWNWSSPHWAWSGRNPGDPHGFPCTLLDEGHQMKTNELSVSVTGGWVGGLGDLLFVSKLTRI